MNGISESRYDEARTEDKSVQDSHDGSNVNDA